MGEGNQARTHNVNRQEKEDKGLEQNRVGGKMEKSIKTTA